MLPDHHRTFGENDGLDRRELEQLPRERNVVRVRGIEERLSQLARDPPIQNEPTDVAVRRFVELDRDVCRAAHHKNSCPGLPIHIHPASSVNTGGIVPESSVGPVCAQLHADQTLTRPCSGPGSGPG